MKEAIVRGPAEPGKLTQWFGTTGRNANEKKNEREREREGDRDTLIRSVRYLQPFKKKAPFEVFINITCEARGK